MMMISSKPIIRTCVSCRQKADRNELIKITKNDDYWYVDKDLKIKGRSIYLHKNDKCINLFDKFQKRFKLTDENFKNITKELNE